MYKFQVLISVCVLLMVSASILAQQPDSTTPADTLHPKILEERIKALDEKIDKVDEERQRELDKSVSGMNERMNVYLGLAAAVLALLGYLGHKTIVKWIQQTIREKTDELFRENEEDFKRRAEREADELLADMIARGKARIDAVEAEGKKKLSAFDAEHKAFLARRENLIAKLTSTTDNADDEPESTMKEVAEYTGELSSVKTEEEYTEADWFLKGFHARKSRNYREAVRFYSRAIELNSSNAKAYTGRAQALGRLGRLNDALADYDKAIDVQPYYVTACQNAAEAELISCRFEASLQRSERALRISRSDYRRAISLFLICLARKLLSLKTADQERRLEKLLQHVNNVTWSFDLIEYWLKTADIPDDAREFIREKTELLKAKRKMSE